MGMKTFRNKNFTERDYECTNLVACRAETAPAGNWEECEDSVLFGLTQLYIQAGVRYFGWL